MSQVRRSLGDEIELSQCDQEKFTCKPVVPGRPRGHMDSHGHIERDEFVGQLMPLAALWIRAALRWRLVTSLEGLLGIDDYLDISPNGKFNRSDPYER